MMKQTNPPILTDVLNEAKRDVHVNMNCVNIGIIEEFFPETQTASIRLALKQVISIAPDGTKTLKEHPLLLECPVVTLFGGDSFLSMPIVPGDNCLVLFNDREIDNWMYDGGVQVPSSGRTHDISDGIAIVGIRSFQNSIAGYLANAVRLSFAADSRITLSNDAIDSVAALFTHTGNLHVTGNLTIAGDVYGEAGGSTFNLKTDLIQDPGHVIKAGNGATGTFSTVTVADGIVTGGS